MLRQFSLMVNISALILDLIYRFGSLSGIHTLAGKADLSKLHTSALPAGN